MISRLFIEFYTISTHNFLYIWKKGSLFMSDDETQSIISRTKSTYQELLSSKRLKEHNFLQFASALNTFVATKPLKSFYSTDLCKMYEKVYYIYIVYFVFH